MSREASACQLHHEPVIYQTNEPLGQIRLY